jgi:SPP1 Gp6-like portal protein
VAAYGVGVDVIIKQDDVVQTAGSMLSMRGQEQARLRKINKYMRGHHDPPYAPKGASAEYRWIMRRSTRNFLPLVVSVLSQNLHVDGYRPFGQTVAEISSTDNPEPGWQAFVANRMISRQHGVHRAVMKHGVAYVTVLPGVMSVGEEQQAQNVPVVRPVSAGRMTALYANDVDDEWPQLAIEVVKLNDPTVSGKIRLMVTMYDENTRYILMGTPSGQTMPLAIAEPDDPFLDGKPPVSDHGLGVCPVVRFLHENDLDGELDCSGEVEPIMLIQDQINFDTFNMMMAEQYAAFRQRWVTGMAVDDEDGREAQPFRPGVDRMFASDDAATKFGEFEVTPLQPYIEAREAGIRHMSTVSQVPPYHLLGQIANMSAEALAAARDGLDRKIEELQAMLTDPWRNVMRLAAKAAGNSGGWSDLRGTVLWRDTSARSFAATIDALGKAAQMLGIPPEELWRRIPGATADDVEAWRQARLRAEALATAQAAQQQALAVASGSLLSPYPPQAGQNGQPGAPPGQGAPASAGPSPSQPGPSAAPTPAEQRALALLSQPAPAIPRGRST